MAPPPHVLIAFGATGAPERLAGGRGRAWQVGDCVLKPIDLEPDELVWQATELASLAPDGYRLSLPRRAAEGSAVVDGWTAWRTLAGRHEPRRWKDIIQAGRRFHADIAALDRPAFIGRRTHRWAIGDRVAWGELAAGPYRHVPHVSGLLDRLRPVPATSQLIHGDLTGNVLFAADLPPAIIDLALYWRPTAYATAIVVADALVWEGATDDLAEWVVGVEDDFGDAFARALIFRLIAAALGGTEKEGDMTPRYRHAVDLAHTLMSDRT